MTIARHFQIIQQRGEITQQTRRVNSFFKLLVIWFRATIHYGRNAHKDKIRQSSAGEERQCRNAKKMMARIKAWERLCVSVSRHSWCRSSFLFAHHSLSGTHATQETGEQWQAHRVKSKEAEEDRRWRWMWIRLGSDGKLPLTTRRTLPVGHLKCWTIVSLFLRVCEGFFLFLVNFFWKMRDDDHAMESIMEQKRSDA